MDPDRRSRSRSLQVEALEGRLLLSTASRARPRPSGAISLILDGQYKVSPHDPSAPGVLSGDDAPGTPFTIRLPISGRARSMGPVVGQSVQTYDPISEKSMAELVLSNAKGSVRLTLDKTGDPIVVRSGGKTVALRTRFVVASGDGAYAGARGTGTITESFVRRNSPTTIRTTPS